MTTIVWDGRRLVGDKQTTCSSMMSITTKIRRVNGALVGVCGEGSSIQAFADWLQLGGHAERYPKTFKDGDSVAMVIRGDGKVRLYEKEPVPMVLDQDFHAIGSGREFARAALACGKDALGALAIASQLDCYTGSTYDELHLVSGDRLDPND